MKKKRGLYVLITLFISVLISFNVSAMIYSVDYFDKDCYYKLCENSSLYNEESNKCIFQPVVNETKSLSGDVERDVTNKGEFLELNDNLKGGIRDIFLECVKQNQTATVELQKESSRRIIKSLIKIGFYWVVLPIIAVIAIILFISLLGDKITNRKKKKRRKRFYFFIFLIFIIVLSSVHAITDPTPANNNLNVNVNVAPSMEMVKDEN